MWWERHPVLVHVLAALFWGALVAGSLGYTLALHDRQAEEVALTRARVLFDIIETARLWNARHGGVYAEASEDTPPNPYLDDPTRDILVNGKLFSKVNPAYMTRQISELVRARHPVWFNITSLKPIRPGNAPDAWEASALHRFEQGEREVLDHVPEEDGDGGMAFRYMQALTVTEPCLPCHQQQGYKVGDIRGGISVTMPEAHILADMAPQRRQAVALHAGAFLLLAGSNMLFLRRARSDWLALSHAKSEQEDLVARRTRELRVANDALRRSNEDLETFAYVASHDLREPLRMVTSYGGLLRRRAGPALDAESREFLGYMTDGAARMQAMIDDLLAYSRVERAPLRQQRLSLAGALGLVRHDLGVTLRETGATLRQEGEDIALSGDPALLLRLLLNLVANAVKYGHGDAPPTITVRGWTEDAATTVVEVADDGPGIPEDARERVFQMFQRLQPRQAPGSDGAQAARPDGTGMGLAICRRIAERHGGTLWVEPDPPGQGARFRFRLPVTDSAVTETTEDA